MKNYSQTTDNKDIVTKEYLKSNTYSPDNPPPGGAYNIISKSLSINTVAFKRATEYDTGESGKEAYAATVLFAIPQTARFMVDIDLSKVAINRIPATIRSYSKIDRVFSEDANLIFISYDGNPSEDNVPIPIKITYVSDAIDKI